MAPDTQRAPAAPGLLWFEEFSWRRWPDDTWRSQAERWRVAWNANENPAPLRYSVGVERDRPGIAIVDQREIGVSMYAIDQRPIVAPPDPPKPELVPPSADAPWPDHLLHALLTEPESKLANRSLSTIAGRKVPQRIDQGVIGMVLAKTTAGHPGPGQRSTKTMGRLLLCSDDTAREVAAWRARPEKPEPLDPTVAAYVNDYDPLEAACERAKAAANYYRNRKPTHSLAEQYSLSA